MSILLCWLAIGATVTLYALWRGTFPKEYPLHAILFYLMLFLFGPIILLVVIFTPSNTFQKYLKDKG